MTLGQICCTRAHSKIEESVLSEHPIDRDCRALYDAGWTQKAIGEQLGISRSAVSRSLNRRSRIHTMDPAIIDKMKIRAAL